MFVQYDYVPDVVHAYNECGNKPYVLYYSNQQYNKLTKNATIDELKKRTWVHFITNQVYLITGPFYIATNKEEKTISVVSPALLKCDKCDKVIKVLHTEYECQM